MNRQEILSRIILRFKDSTIEDIRENLSLSVFGPLMLLKDIPCDVFISYDYDTFKQGEPFIHSIYQREKDYRKENNIEI